ncbi:hypothetical protein JNL27_12140 [bacterium]|nr:hypothetical protein [bacterium]
MSEKPLSADEVFVNLIRVAKEDPKIHSFITTVVTMKDFDRKSLINSFIKEMALKGAPSEFIKAIAALREPLLAEKIKELLQKEN